MTKMDALAGLVDATNISRVGENRAPRWKQARYPEKCVNKVPMLQCSQRIRNKRFVRPWDTMMMTLSASTGWRCLRGKCECLGGEGIKVL